MSVLLGVLFLGAAWALARGWSLLPLGIYAFSAGLAAIVLGTRFINLSLTPVPLLPGVGFILTGLGGVCAGAVLYQQDTKILRLTGGMVMLAAAVLWALTAGMAYWAHMKVTPPSPTVTSWLPPSPWNVDATTLVS
jgi:putative membrane protein